jgi:hypothetical protein
MDENDTPSMVLNPGEIIPHSKIDKIMLGGIYKTMLFNSTQEIIFSDQNSPHWIDAAKTENENIDVPLEGIVKEGIFLFVAYVIHVFFS